MGLSNSILLAQHNEVYAVDIIQEKVDMINQRKSPIVDREIQDYLSRENLNLKATVNASMAYAGADFVIVSTPTNYDEKKNYFDTSSVESVITQVREENKDAFIIVKSTVPVGYTQQMREEYGTDHILFSPEFLREGHALYDNLYPSRIIVGYDIDSISATGAVGVSTNATAIKSIPASVSLPALTSCVVMVDKSDAEGLVVA